MEPGISTPLLSRQETRRVPPKLELFRGFILAFSAGLHGLDIAFTAIGQPQLGLTNEQTVWFTNLFSLCSPIGSVIGAVIQDKLGRRITLIYGLLPNLLGWTCLYCSPNVAVTLIGRSICGISKGLIGVTGQVHGCESLFFDYPYVRESFKTWSGLLISVCIIASELFAHVLTYQDIAAIAFALTLMELIFVHYFLPESPCWLQYRGRRAEMDESCKSFSVPASALSDQNILNALSHPSEIHGSFLQRLKRDDVYKPLKATTVLLALTAFVGGHQVIEYESANKIYVKTNTYAVDGDSLFSRCVIFGSSLFVAIIIPFVGFKKIVSTGLTLLSISLVLYAGAYAFDAPDWQPIILFMIILFFDFGLFNLNYILLAYVFPVDAKGLSNVGLGVFSLLSTFALYIHPYLRTMLDWWIYLAYAAVDILLVFWIRFYLPEVVGKSQSEIRQFFSKKIHT